MKLKFTRKALSQIEEQHAFLAERNSNAADAFAKSVFQTIDQLKTFPAAGRSTDWPNVRVLPVKGTRHLVFYQIEHDGITVLRVRHSSQNPDEHLS